MLAQAAHLCRVQRLKVRVRQLVSGLPGDGLAPQTQHQVQGGLLLDVVVRERAAVLELLAREDEALLFGGVL